MGLKKKGKYLLRRRIFHREIIPLIGFFKVLLSLTSVVNYRRQRDRAFGHRVSKYADLGKIFVYVVCTVGMQRGGVEEDEVRRGKEIVRSSCFKMRFES